MDIFLIDLVPGISDKLQALFHSVDAILALGRRGIARQNLMDTVSSSSNLFDSKCGKDLLFHSLHAVELLAVLRGQQYLNCGKMDLGYTLQIDQISTIKILQWQLLVKAVSQQRNKIPSYQLAGTYISIF